MSVTQLVRSTQLKPGTAYRTLVNDGTGKMSENAALTAAYALISDANGQPAISSVTSTVLSYLDVGSSVNTLIGNKLPLAGGTMSGAIAMGTSKITGMGNPSDDQDAATKFYVDSVAQGLNVHAACHVATTAELTVTPAGTKATHTLTFAVGAQSIDSHPLVLADRVLVKNQTTGVNQDNGIYTVTTLGVTGVKAAGTITFNTPVDGDTVIINGTTFTKVASDPGAGEFVTITQLTALVTEVPLVDATDNGTVIAVVAASAGIAGNSITLAIGTNGGDLEISGATLTGGVNAVACVLTRAADFNGVPSGEVATGDFSFVQIGTILGGSGWVVTSGAGTIDVDVASNPIVWTQFSSAGSYTADGQGIELSGGQFSLELDGSTLSKSSSGLKLAIGGTDKQIQYNNSGVLGASSNFTWDDATLKLAFTSAGNGYIDYETNNCFIFKTASDDSAWLTAIGEVVIAANTGTTQSPSLELKTDQNVILFTEGLALSADNQNTVPDASALLDVQSTTQGILSPRMTADQRDDIVDPATGLEIYNTDTNLLNWYNGTAWKEILGNVLTETYIFVGNSSNVATSVALSADATISNAGALTIASSAVTFAKTNEIVLEKVNETPNGTIVIFSVDNALVSGSEMVFVNGVVQQKGSGNDYTVTKTTIPAEITFEAGNAPPTGSEVLVTYWKL
jgi:hypothetical protein